MSEKNSATPGDAELSAKTTAGDAGQIAAALLEKAGSLQAFGSSEEQVSLCDELLARFGAATELPLREQVAHALHVKAGTLFQLDRHEEARAAFDEVVKRFGDASEL